jgi:hypothetical protein
MQLSKGLQQQVSKCDINPLIDCEACEGNREWNHFMLCDLVEYTRKERIWYCPNCVMIGNFEEFHTAGEGLACNRCSTPVEEITLEQ